MATMMMIGGGGIISLELPVLSWMDLHVQHVGKL